MSSGCSLTRNLICCLSSHTYCSNVGRQHWYDQWGWNSEGGLEEADGYSVIRREKPRYTLHWSLNKLGRTWSRLCLTWTWWLESSRPGWWKGAPKGVSLNPLSGVKETAPSYLRPWSCITLSWPLVGPCQPLGQVKAFMWGGASLPPSLSLISFTVCITFKLWFHSQSNTDSMNSWPDEVPTFVQHLNETKHLRNCPWPQNL